MKYIFFLMVLFQGCLNFSNPDEIEVYKMKTSDNVPQLVKINDTNVLLRKLHTLKVEEEVKVKVYPAYKVELIKKGKLYKTYKISGRIVFVDDKSYRVEEDIEEFISTLIK